LEAHIELQIYAELNIRVCYDSDTYMQAEHIASLKCTQSHETQAETNLLGRNVNSSEIFQTLWKSTQWKGET
jgi:hypothetical protein